MLSVKLRRLSKSIVKVVCQRIRSDTRKSLNMYNRSYYLYHALALCTPQHKSTHTLLPHRIGIRVCNHLFTFTLKFTFYSSNFSHLELVGFAFLLCGGPLPPCPAAREWPAAPFLESPTDRLQWCPKRRKPGASAWGEGGVVAVAAGVRARQLQRRRKLQRRHALHLFLLLLLVCCGEQRGWRQWPSTAAAQ